MTGRYSLKSVVILAVPALLFMLSSAAFAPVFADNLSLGGGNCPGGASISSGAATVTCTPFNSPALTMTSTQTGDLSTGIFGASANVVNAPGFPSAGGGGGGSIGAFFQVTYLFGGLGNLNGTAQFDMTANGILASTECNGNCTSGTGPVTAEFEYLGGPITINGSAAPGQSPLGPGISRIVITTPVINGSTELQFALAVNASCFGIDGCTSTADFLDPLSITGASAYDANGNLVSGASLVSQSGFNPNAGSPVPTPEPSSLLLLGTGLLALIGTAKLKAVTA